MIGSALVRPAGSHATVIDGVAFVEFAFDEAEWAPFSRVIAALGFSMVSRRRSKGASHWQQGGIRLILNSEKEDFAHSYEITQGFSVCMVALEVSSAHQALERACCLLDMLLVLKRFNLRAMRRYNR
jgi:4-hydroxyphenylpyruvate dioxygenase